MARSFGDIGASIFDFFGGSSDIYRSVGLSSKSGPTSFNVSRNNKDDGSIETSLSVKQQFEKYGSISVTSSDSENPSVTMESDKKLIKSLCISSTICDPDLSLNIGYNDEKKYDLGLNINTNFGNRQLQDIDISLSYDSLLNKKLLIGTNININQTNQEQNYGFGAEYAINDRLSVAVLALDKLKNFDVGISVNNFRGNQKNTLFGKVSAGTDDNDKSEINYSVGLRREINKNSSIDFSVNNIDKINVVYNTSNDGNNNSFNLSGFIAADLDFAPDAAARAKLRYGISID